MKNLIFILLTIFVGTSVFAEEANFTPNLLLGNYSIGGAITLQKETSANTSDVTYFDVDLGSEYFVQDTFSVGLAFSLSTITAKDTTGLLGPAASYFFWQSDRLAAYIHAAYQFGLSDATVKSKLNVKLGLDYFVTPSVAIGPSIFTNHYYSHYVDFDRYGIMIGISTFL